MEAESAPNAYGTPGAGGAAPSGGRKRGPGPSGTAEITVRRARTSDVPAVRGLIDAYARDRILLDKATVTLYEDIQEFWVAERDHDERVVACGALHVMWEDLAEVRTLAVDPQLKGQGVGHRVLAELLRTARRLGVRRIFCLTFEVEFFARHGFAEIGDAPVPGDVYSELLRSYDEGVAEFLGLERVKPNTLGNTRMLLHL
ncbi:amino-acid N-acetyltransferase [Streptomyces sodiiphilus]|uniref:Amino-acid N-acetyltransferase n=1 Tax=Streptomyces sodiiphilus TaxID=226217 RepID=A0ABN2PQZ1_9ACTN